MSEYDSNKDGSIFGQDNVKTFSSPDWTKGIVNNPFGTTELVKTGKLECDSDAYGRRIAIVSSTMPPKDGETEATVIREVYMKVGSIFESKPFTKDDGTEYNPDHKMNGKITIPTMVKEKKVYLYLNAGGSYGLALHDKSSDNENNNE